MPGNYLLHPLELFVMPFDTGSFALETAGLSTEPAVLSDELPGVHLGIILKGRLVRNAVPPEKLGDVLLFLR